MEKRYFIGKAAGDVSGEEHMIHAMHFSIRQADGHESGAADCRLGCGACCIAPSISSAIPGMPGGKPAGVRCIQLDQENRCKLFGNPERPTVCASLKASEEMCGIDRQHALFYLACLEQATTT